MEVSPFSREENYRRENIFKRSSADEMRLFCKIYRKSLKEGTNKPHSKLGAECSIFLPLSFFQVMIIKIEYPLPNTSHFCLQIELEW